MPAIGLRSTIALAMLALVLLPPAGGAQEIPERLLRLPPTSEAQPAAVRGPQLFVDVTAQPVATVRQPVAPDYGPPGFQPRESQDAPGVPEFSPDYDRYSDPVPSYVYDPDYYNYYDSAVHQIADYAPPGYETRDYQSAPGDPEYTPITPPVRVTQSEREKFVVGGIAPGSFLAPGTNTSVRIRGFVRLAALYDLDPIGLRDAFVPNTIPVPQTDGQNYNMSGRISRFGIETWTPTNWCDRTVHTFIEGDFFNGPDQAAGGGGNPFRLRHAFFDIGWFRFGQQNTVFMDGTNWPSLVDFQGPNGWTNQRQPSARVTVPLADRLFWASSMERPFSNINTNGLGAQVQDIPDFATHLRFESDVGHLQVAGLVRSIGYQPTGGEVTRQNGLGVSGSVVFHPWALAFGTNPVRDEDPSGFTRSRILLQGTWGEGVARYINDFSGQNLDGQVNPVTGQFDTIPVTGWHASYELWLSEHWLSNITYSRVRSDSIANQPATTYQGGQYLALSGWWIPVTRMSFGVEYIWGERENLDGQTAKAQRVHGLFQYNF
ncbi:MAG: DcaP family trimeric outer membrane transporter [Pirellulaceae bacterium]|nr:DcaP family trimeric outer membrane transporter [Pirellulaceae bacterium]